MERSRITKEWLLGAVVLLAPVIAAVAEEPAKAASGPRSFAVKVTQEGTKQPIAGAAVRIKRIVYPDPATGGKRVLEQTDHQTDAKGECQFSISPEQLAMPQLGVFFEVRHPDHPPLEEREYTLRLALAAEARGGESLDRFDLALPRGEVITGEVVTPEGAPAAGVLVHSFSFNAPDPKPGNLVSGTPDDVRTDDHGRFRLVVVTPGKVELSFYSDRYAVLTKQLKESARGDIGKFALRDGITIRGRVVDHDGKPLSDVVVDATGVIDLPDTSRHGLPGEDTNRDVSRAAITDAKGEFTMSPLPPGSFRVVPVEQHHDPVLGDQFRKLPAPFVPKRVKLETGKGAAAIEIRALPSVVVEARISDRQGRPVSGENFLLIGHMDPEGKFKLDDTSDDLKLPEFPGADDQWTGWSWPDGDGRIVWHAPLNLQNAALSVVGAGAEYVLRARLGAEGSLQTGEILMLGSLEHDMKGIEIVQCVSPSLNVKVVDKQGAAIKAATLKAFYVDVDPKKVAMVKDRAAAMLKRLGLDLDNLAELAELDPDLLRVDLAAELDPDDLRDEADFLPTNDGTFRFYSLHPDRKLTLHVTAEGYTTRTETLELAEGAVKELKVVLEKK